MTQRFSYIRVAWLVILSAGLSVAQQTGVTGRLMDQTNAALASAVVTVTGDDGSKLETVTNSQGIYQFPALRAAKYLLRFQAPGFAPAERTLSLLVGQIADVDVTLQLASANSSVAVQAEAAAVDTTTSTIAGDVSPAEVARIPLNGRNYLQTANYSCNVASECRSSA